MALTLALGKGITSKFVYGSLIGGALGYMAGKMSESNPRSRLAKHLYRFGKELSSDPELSIDLFENDKKYSSPKKKYIDYETSKKEFNSFHKNNDDNDYKSNYDYKKSKCEENKYYKDYTEFKDNNEDKETSNYSYKRKNNSYTRNYDTKNYTSNYD